MLVLAAGCRLLDVGCWMLVSGRIVRRKRRELFTLRSGNAWKPDGGSATAGPTDDCLLPSETSKMQRWPVG